ncbi:hypothetical protein LCGC14_0400400 [marine sediment metagenome]|uniref:Uncharacterized protein n=1 Tax=marine sediment metagenome TaxID=412755 RepID=A0A0F9SX23_9ZZZZ
MAVIVKADIITDVNENLQLGLAAGSTDLDRAIIKTLTDMSNRGLLVGTDATQTLVDGSTTLAYPTGFRKGGVINITLIDGSGVEKTPLIKLRGGHQEYRELRHNDNTSGVTEEYSEFNKQFFLWRPANQAYTTLIEYRKNHAKDADSIEFETEFESLMFAGTTFWKAIATKRTSSIAIWSPMYDREMSAAVANRNIQPGIVGG